MIYEPAEDSYLLECQVKKYSKGKSFLDMGSASGIQSEATLKSNAKSVLAVDFQDDVIKYLKSKKIKCIKSNLFSKVKGKFDLIAFNPPYLPKDKIEDKESQKITSGGKKGDELTLRFLKKAPEHLNKEGIILLVTSSLTPKERIMSLMNKISLSHTILDSKKLFMEELEVWKIENLSKV